MLPQSWPPTQPGQQPVSRSSRVLSDTGGTGGGEASRLRGHSLLKHLVRLRWALIALDLLRLVMERQERAQAVALGRLAYHELDHALAPETDFEYLRSSTGGIPE